jgi:nitrate reductase gamma subunit
VLAVRRGLKPAERPGDLPPQDRLALGLIGGIVVIGFVLEGMRMAMTGHPPGSGFAFVGYIFSLLFGGSSTVNDYGYVWYLHAILTGAFIAYLPFSRLFHIIAAPIVLLMNSAQKFEHGH